MDLNEFRKTAHQYYKFAEDVLVKKQNDYGPLNISRSPGGPLNGLRVRIHDKISRINHLIDSGVSPENESLKDSFLDLANYSIIAMMVLEEEWPEKVNVSYESLRQEGREEVLEWLRQQEVIGYSKPENSYFYMKPNTEWLLVLPWKRDQSK